MEQNETDARKKHYSELPITFDFATSQDIRLLEWKGEFAHLRRQFRRAFVQQHRGKRLILVARYKSYPIGRLFILLGNPTTIKTDSKRRAYLYSFRVMNLFQSMGIGTQLMEMAESILIEREFESAIIAVAKTNYGALRLYQQRGYKIFTENPGEWQYYDHRNRLRKVMEPCWMLEKTL
ncbi:MAG: GNAT family N-acetyltransferase [Anaerolineae bacterium]|nr:GNAT family N-acetyltransferase [Anaerolineae bacterium]MCA9895626.1 GNAT family N-acetyltransferase [Anaerolineae bacterium]